MYKNLNKIKAKIYDNKEIDYIDNVEFELVLLRNNINKEEFNEKFGCQTCFLLENGHIGMYAYDVEAVLELILNKKKTGTQLYLD